MGIIFIFWGFPIRKWFRDYKLDLTVQVIFWCCTTGSITGGHDPQLRRPLVPRSRKCLKPRSNGDSHSLLYVNLNSFDVCLPADSYGSDLVVVESYQQNNISERLAQEQLNPVTHPDAAFWLGLMSLDDLSTNTLEAASGSLVQQYAGNDR